MSHLGFWVFSHFEFKIFLSLFEFFWVISDFEFLSFVTSWVYEFWHLFSFWVMSLFEYFSFCVFDFFFSHSSFKILSHYFVVFLSFEFFLVWQFFSYLCQNKFEKSRIRETKHLSTNKDSSTDTIIFFDLIDLVITDLLSLNSQRKKKYIYT